MPYQFDEHDAADLTNMIRRRRPQWSTQGIMRQLQQAAERNATISQATSAAEKTWNNPKANTPAALNWPEHWQSDTKTKAAGNINAPRLCVECTPARKHPVEQMTKQAHGYVCGEHQEENK